jgi:branched-chain amino acid transport system ATP-binding protein
MALLEIRNLNRSFGGLMAINQVSFDVCDLEILGLIGPNGAGKTTLFNLISGFLSPSGGQISFKGENVIGLRADQIAQKGIGRTFQASTLFMQETVFENVFTGFYTSHKKPGWKALFHTSDVRKEEETIKAKAMEIIDYMGLASVQRELAGALPHGSQRALGVSIALATNPRLLLLDEPMAGMNPSETAHMVHLIKQLRDKGITLIVVEHDMKAIMSLCDRIVVLNYGRKIAEGPPSDLNTNQEVIEAYLGCEEE